MTDSTTDTSSGDSAFDIGSSVDELFGDLETDDWGADRPTTDDEAAGREEPDDVEDRTAADVFEQLRADAEDEGGADDVLEDESPEDIIASADEPDPEPDAPVDDELLADEDELADLLLTGRTKDQEFLWVETEDSSEPDELGESAEGSDSPATDADSESATDEPADGVDDASAGDEHDELVDRLFGDEDAPKYDPDEASAADADTESERDSPSNSSIAVTTEAGETDSSAETGADGSPAADSDNDTAADETDADSDDSSGFFGRLLPFMG
ncbi:hypothetical protein [Natrinema marinum]|uniref:hypothetical protein n=1 Tax=Natrinema marinum TaxID=2961598 RepID=UPI0020C8C2A4|nr:hypothetical protein [Natrinema marinum]